MFVPESHQIDFQDGRNILFICVSQALFTCPEQPVYFSEAVQDDSNHSFTYVFTSCFGKDMAKCLQDKALDIRRKLPDYSLSQLFIPFYCNYSVVAQYVSCMRIQ